MALAGCDRVFGLGDPYEDASVKGDAVLDVRPPGDVPPIEDAAPLPALVAHFGFENTFNDDSGMYIGTDIGSGITFAIGHKGSGMAIDGTSCIEVTIPTRPSKFTIAFWAKPTGSMNSGGMLVSRRFDTTATSYSYQIYDGAAGGGFGFQMLDSTGGTDGVVVSGFALNTWRHYAVTFDGATKRWWLDGSPANVQTAGAITYGAVNDEYIGCQDGSSKFFQGMIDELYIYDGALDQAQLAVVANQ